jgi:hypothetical protein
LASYSFSSGVTKRSPPVIVAGDELQVRLRDLDVVAEDLVVADLERADAGARALARLELGDPALAVVAKRAKLVDLGRVAGADEIALPRARGRRVDERAADEIRELRKRIHAIAKSREEPTAAIGQALLHRRAPRERLAKPDEIARRRRAAADPPGEPLEIAETVERGAEVVAYRGLSDELLDGVEPLADPHRIEQWIEEPATERARADRRLGAVENP